MQPNDNASRHSTGIGTLVNHLGEFDNPLQAHLMPIYQTATFCFPAAEQGAAIFSGEQHGYIYSRLGNPNFDLLAAKIAALEALDLQSTGGEQTPVTARLFSSGMAAVHAALLGCAQAGDILIAQKAVYGNTYLVLEKIAPQLGLQVVWVEKPDPENWERAFAQHPGSVLAYAESPVNPAMAVVDLQAVAEIAHQYGARLLVDNTFATPYCQRPLALGADLVIHATTKYLSGHGAIIGGVVVGRDRDLMDERIGFVQKYLGAVPSPFDAWLANLGLKTFELRMARHCSNALQIARFLETHPAVAVVHYPGLESHPAHALARRQMSCFGGMMSFELRGGLAAGRHLLDRVQVATLAVSLGNVDTLIQHPATMTHSSVPRQQRLEMGISDGLVRLSVGIENLEDLIADFEQALPKG